MIEHIFPPEMMLKREEQLMQALLDCAGVCYDVNFTRNLILGCPIQVVDGMSYPILEVIGKKRGCSYTELIDYWVPQMPVEEQAGYREFARIDRIAERYAAGETRLNHSFWTNDVLGNPMLAEQYVRLYEDVTSGDLLGLIYMTNGRDMDTMVKQEAVLTEKYRNALDKVMQWENFGVHIPGGYHRTSTRDEFSLQFMSESFLEIVGWTEEQIKTEMHSNYLELVAPEDRAFFMQHEPVLAETGRIDLTYRIRRPDGTRRWVKDTTNRMVQDGEVFYQCSLADITDYVEKLNAEKARAEASSQAKTTFLFNASHDIRTPMNAIQGFARILEQNADNPEIVRTTVRKIIESGNTLMTLLNDVLELSRIERGKEAVEMQPLNMEEFARKLEAMFADEMESAGIVFAMENDICHANVLGDELKLTRIAMNLLSNAKKFTPRGGRVVFGIRETPLDEEHAMYSILVQDTGIGMSREFQERAFEQFERERTSTESGVPGSGLGLAIIKRLCDLMKGQCTIRSELGRGTEITASIPLKQNVAAAQDEKPIPKMVDLSGKRILLVEDNDFNREIARYLLEEMGVLVEEAVNGAEAVERMLRAGENRIDLVLMDVQMPVMDGYRATKEIRSIEDAAISQVPIIAMTANAFKEDVDKCQRVGMNAHLSKPVDAALLKTMIIRYCAR